MYAEIVQEPHFFLDSKGVFFPEATTFILTGEHLSYLYNLFHTRTITYLFKTFYAGGGLGESGFRYKKAFLEKLPIPQYEDTTLQKQIIQMGDKNINEMLVYKLYKFSQEEIIYIENRES